LSLRPSNESSVALPRRLTTGFQTHLSNLQTRKTQSPGETDKTRRLHDREHDFNRRRVKRPNRAFSI
ncbi:hypothetical protein N9053_02205, partial [bacterium]|nr:hypothetical protein [bacterium]